MRASKWAVALMCVMLVGTAVMAVADDAGPTTRPHTMGRPRLPMLFSKLTDLTDDQKAKIIEIQTTADAEIKKIHDQALADQTAVLTDDQKTELAAEEAKAKLGKKADKAETKAKMDEEKAEKLRQDAAGATTQPAN